MSNKRLYTSYLTTGLYILLSYTSSAQITDWQVDPTYTTQYQVPKDWKVNVSQEQGVYLWQAKENPDNSLAADITVLSMPDFPNSSPTFFINQLENTIQEFKLLETKKISEDEYHYKAAGLMEGAKVSSNLVFLRDRNTQFLFLASFSAQENNYSRLGGTSVLYQALQRTDPFAVSTKPDLVDASTTGTKPEIWNMQSLEVQNHLITRGLVPQKKDLLGKWIQSFSYQTGTATQNLTSGEITYGERGYGHLFTFMNDDTYTLTYKYNSVSQGCPYQADIFEKGRFKLEGQNLILYADQYEGSYNLCNKISPEKNTTPPIRYFNVYVDSDMKRLLITGQTLEYSIGFETDANGNNYIQEGFNKIK